MQQLSLDVQRELQRYIPQIVLEVRDDNVGLHAFIVVDSTQSGRSCGGLRCDPGVSVDQLKALARGMTLKYGFNGMRQGGAKAGLVAPAELAPEDKARLLRRLGELIAPILRTQLYISGPDMSISSGDIDLMYEAAGVRVAKPRRSKGKKSGFFTALGVMVALEAAAEARGTALRGRTVAIEGFGSVGSALASLLVSRHGMKLVAVSSSYGAVYEPAGLNVERLLALRAELGNEAVVAYEGGERIGNKDLLLLDVDVVAPCALQYSITLDNADGVRAGIVCPGANNPVTDAAERRLAERGIASVPYFMANCGGVLGNKLEVLDVSDGFVEEFFRRKIHPRVASLMRRAAAEERTPREIAEEYALRRVAQLKREVPDRGLRSSMRRGALQLFNTGVVPAGLLRPLAPRYFAVTMGGDPAL